MSETNMNRRLWKTPFTSAFRVRLPIISAPSRSLHGHFLFIFEKENKTSLTPIYTTYTIISVAGVSGGLLAARVCKAGGLGMIAAGHFQDMDKLEKQITIFQEETMKKTDDDEKDDVFSTDKSPEHSDLAIGFIGFSSLSTPRGWEDYEYVLKTHRPKAVQFFAPSIMINPDNGGLSNVQLAQKYNAKFIAQVGSISEANEAIKHKVNAIICQGSEAGGHGMRRELGNSTMALASQVSKMTTTNIPVLAAGGIVNGRHLASALCVCDGASIGTRYWACSESQGNQVFQQELIKKNSCDDVIRTTVFDQIHHELNFTIKWPYPYHSVGSLRNATSSKWDGKPSEELQHAMNDTELLKDYKSAQQASDPNVVCTLAGEGVGEIERIEGAYDVTLKIEEEAIDTIHRLQGMFL